jgi:hypothetical protein
MFIGTDGKGTLQKEATVILALSKAGVLVLKAPPGKFTLVKSKIPT